MGAPRYDRFARWLHALMGLALLAQIGFGFALDELAPRGTPARAGVINLHKSWGLILLGLLLLRLFWRLRQPSPGWPARMSRAQTLAALWGHRALYACMLLMPLSAYLASNFSKHGIKFFGHAIAPWGPESPAVYAALNGFHKGLAWVFCALILGHIAMALKHHFVDRDGLLQRIWP
ncbi:cytochrome b [Paucibacter sp. KBW04]|uniref:cytochrome b n=1 Tax=Paucibacter sp. KBW04 TaxID=2153361 RepID=UPI000F586B02|nr:cytochrome b/b6 domain-containing protein [Paucibacter sp. KBW04]RQO63482.1 cytochrome b [Paucibacter sp. KBW04]